MLQKFEPMTEQINKLTKVQKFFGVLFILSFGFCLCICTPLSPSPLYKGIIGEPTATALAAPLGGGEIQVLGIPLPNILASLFGLINGCFAIAITVIGFCLATVFKWRSEVREDNQKHLEMWKVRIELEKQRLELEKQRLELEKQRSGIEENQEEES